MGMFLFGMFSLLSSDMSTNGYEVHLPTRVAYKSWRQEAPPKVTESSWACLSSTEKPVRTRRKKPPPREREDLGPPNNDHPMQADHITGPLR